MCQICWCIQRNVLKKIPSQIHFVYHKSSMYWPGIEPNPPGWEASDWPQVMIPKIRICSFYTLMLRRCAGLSDLVVSWPNLVQIGRLMSKLFEPGRTQNFSLGRGQTVRLHIAHLRQECHNSKSVIFQEKLLKVLKCYNFLWVQRRHNCSPAASFANCIMTIYLLKVHLQTFLSTPVTQKCQIFSCDTLVANERYNLCLILKTVLQKSCHQYNCNLTRFSTAFTNI